LVSFFPEKTEKEREEQVESTKKKDFSDYDKSKTECRLSCSADSFLVVSALRTRAALQQLDSSGVTMFAILALSDEQYKKLVTLPTLSKGVPALPHLAWN
jgi:hypothetical protein